MATYKYGDIAKIDNEITDADVEALKNILADGTLPKFLNYILTNVTQKDPYKGGFFEVLKLTKNRGTMPTYDGLSFLQRIKCIVR